MKEAEKIKGFTKLTLQAQQIFKELLKNYYAVWEFPEDHEIIKVSISKEEGKDFIRVDCENEWFHVKSPHSWY